MAPKLSCRLVPATALGFFRRIAASTIERAVSASSSLRNSGAESRHICINTALVTDGVNPVIAAKNRSIGKAAITAHRRRPSSRNTNPVRNEICMPDTATTWDSPASARL